MPSKPLRRQLDHPSIDRVDRLPVDLIRNKRTHERGQAVGRRTWKRQQRSVSMIDVRIDSGASYTFKTWTARNCEVLVGERVLAAR